MLSPIYRKKTAKTFSLYGLTRAYAHPERTARGTRRTGRMTRGKRATHAVASPAGGATYRVRIGVLRPVRATEIIAQRSAASRAERYRAEIESIKRTRASTVYPVACT